MRNSRPTDPPGDTPTGDLGIMTESTLNIAFIGDGTNGTPDDRPPATDGVADRTLTRTPTQPEGVPEGTTITPIMRPE